MVKDADVKHILALIPNWIGDVSMCTPALRALHNTFPAAQLSVAGRTGPCALLAHLPWIAERIVIPEKPSFFTLLKLARHCAPLGRDLVVVFPHSFRAALFAWMIHGRTRIGYARNGRSWLFTHRALPYREAGVITPIYMAREYLDLVALAGCEDDGKGLELGVPPALAKRTREAYADRHPVIGIAPGAAFGPSKRWMPEAFAAAATLIARHCEASFVLLTGPGEEDIRNTIVEHAKVNFITIETDCTGLDVLKTSIAHLDLLLCNDSGPRHIAIAFQRPVVCIMGPTSPCYSEGPYEIGTRLQVSIPCSPCQQPVCPLGHHQCMRAITPEQVATAALEWLPGTDGGAPCGAPSKV